MPRQSVYDMDFTRVYSALVAKAERKGRTREEESITDTRPEQLSDLEQIILVYCRSGRRSKEAAQKLADMGYTNIYEFGGIIDWTGEIEK